MERDEDGISLTTGGVTVDAARAVGASRAGTVQSGWDRPVRGADLARGPEPIRWPRDLGAGQRVPTENPVITKGQRRRRLPPRGDSSSPRPLSNKPLQDHCGSCSNLRQQHCTWPVGLSSNGFLCWLNKEARRIKTAGNARCRTPESKSLESSTYKIYRAIKQPPPGTIIAEK